MTRKLHAESARPRQSDIARLAGVSQGTVSLVINGRASEGRIPDETRDRVLSVAQGLGYVPDPAARRLAGGSNRLIGIFTYESVFPMSQHDFYHPFLVGIEERAEQHGYDLVLFTGATGPTGKRGIFVDGQNRIGLADGAIILGRQMSKDEIIRLHAEGYPFTLVGRRDLPGEIPFVTADYRRGTSEAFGELLALGHTRVAYVASTEDTEPGRDRQNGFKDAQAAYGGRLSLVEVDGSRGTETTDAVARLVRDGVTAIVTHFAESAIEMHAALVGRGIRVPEDLSILALNDPPIDHPEIGGLRIPRREMGATAFDLLIDQLEGERPSRHANRVISTEFDPGHTIAEPGPSRRKS